MELPQPKVGSGQSLIVVKYIAGVMGHCSWVAVQLGDGGSIRIQLNDTTVYMLNRVDDMREP